MYSKFIINEYFLMIISIGSLQTIVFIESRSCSNDKGVSSRYKIKHSFHNRNGSHMVNSGLHDCYQLSSKLGDVEKISATVTWD